MENQVTSSDIKTEELVTEESMAMEAMYLAKKFKENGSQADSLTKEELRFLENYLDQSPEEVLSFLNCELTRPEKKEEKIVAYEFGDGMNTAEATFKKLGELYRRKT